MAKKLVPLAMAVAAFAAMAIPATASALTLADSGGRVQPTKWLVGTSSNTRTTHTAVGALFCPHVLFAAEVQANNGSLITAANGAVGPLLNCEAGEGAELTVTNPKLEHMESTGDDEGTAELSFTADVGAFKCSFSGVVPFTYETGSTHTSLALSGPITSAFKFCEEEEGEGEPATFEATFQMSTTNGSPVWVEAATASGLTLTDAEGKVGSGEWLVGTTTNTKITNTAVGTLFCPHMEFAAEVQTNTGSLITAANGAVGPLPNCEAGGVAKATFTEPKVTHIETSAGDEGNFALSFTLDVGAFKCPFGGTLGFNYETGPTHNTISVSGPITSTFKFCEEEEGEGEPAIVEATFTLSTTDGSPVWIEPGA